MRNGSMMVRTTSIISPGAAGRPNWPPRRQGSRRPYRGAAASAPAAAPLFPIQVHWLPVCCHHHRSPFGALPAKYNSPPNSGRRHVCENPAYLRPRLPAVRRPFRVRRAIDHARRIQNHHRFAAIAQRRDPRRHAGDRSAEIPGAPGVPAHAHHPVRVPAIFRQPRTPRCPRRRSPPACP